MIIDALNLEASEISGMNDDVLRAFVVWLYLIDLQELSLIERYKLKEDHVPSYVAEIKESIVEK
jgi:hypothetical protein